MTLSDQSGNPFQRNLDFRGFTASPVPGTPQNFAVYQNGVRINEAYGDVVNWNFIPETAIRRLSLVPNDPIYGLNAIGGALNIEMKNGFNYQDKEVQVQGGSYGRVQGGAQAGVQDGNLSAYVNVDATDDRGWRQFSSQSSLRRMYLDLGGRNDETEFHVTFTGSDDKLGAVAATPTQLLAQNWASVYTWPQTTRLQLAFLTASLNYSPSETLLLQGNGYFRGYRAAHVDGNGTDGQPCDPAARWPVSSASATAIRRSISTAPPPTPFRPPPILGEIDRNWTATNSFGGTAQATSSAKLFGHDNHVVDRHQPRSRPHPVQRQQRTRHHRPEPVRQRHRHLHRPAVRRHQPGEPAHRQYLYGNLCHRHRRCDARSSPSPRAPASTSPRSICSTRPGPIRCSTATTISSISTRCLARPTRSSPNLTAYAGIRSPTARRRRWTRLLEPDHAVHDRQLPDRRSAP